MQAYKSYFDALYPLPAATWDDFSILFRKQELKRHDYFALADRVEKEIALVTDGLFRAFYRDAKGNEFNKAFFEKGELIGAYTSLISGEPNRIFFQALGPAEIYTASYAAITRLYDRHPALERFARLHAEAVFMAKDRREVELVLLSAAERYALFKKEYPGLENRIPQYHIASYLGVTATQLSRIRSKR